MFFVAERVECLDTDTGTTRGGCNKEDEREQVEELLRKKYKKGEVVVVRVEEAMHGITASKVGQDDSADQRASSETD